MVKKGMTEQCPIYKEKNLTATIGGPSFQLRLEYLTAEHTEEAQRAQRKKR